jgi:hypothetical protein
MGLTLWFYDLWFIGMGLVLYDIIKCEKKFKRFFLYNFYSLVNLKIFLYEF